MLCGVTVLACNSCGMFSMLWTMTSTPTPAGIVTSPVLVIDPTPLAYTPWTPPVFVVSTPMSGPLLAWAAGD